MSVVSRELGFFNIVPTKHIKMAVQYNKNDSGAPEPADYTQGEQLPCFNLSKRIRLPALNLMPKQMSGLDPMPLKSMQQNSHAAGSSLFEADTPAFTAQLDMESDMPSIHRDTHKYAVSKFSESMPDMSYNKGLGGSRAIDFSNISEPVGDTFRRGVGERRYAPTHISYDMGMDELKQMTMR
jgi:hypothetical protein